MRVPCCQAKPIPIHPVLADGQSAENRLGDHAFPGCLGGFSPPAWERRIFINSATPIPTGLPFTTQPHWARGPGFFGKKVGPMATEDRWEKERGFPGFPSETNTGNFSGTVPMNLLDRVSSIFCFFLGLAVITGGVRLGWRVHLDMGPGFFPIIAGGILSLLSIFLFVQSASKRERTRRERPFWVNPEGWKLVFLTLLATIAYPFILNYFGFLSSTFLFLFFLFWVIGYQKWWMAVVSGAGASAVVYLIFEIWLKANFPRGVLSF